MGRLQTDLLRIHRKLRRMVPLYARLEEQVRTRPPNVELLAAHRSATTIAVRTAPLRATDLVEAIETDVQFWWFDDDEVGRLRLGAAGNAAQEILTAVLNFASQNAFAVAEYDRAKSVLRPTEVRALRETLSLDHYVLLALQDLRSGFPPLQILIAAWQRDLGGNLSTPQNNHVLSRFWQSSTAQLEAMPQRFSLEEFLGSSAAQTVGFDIDWVFTYVDGRDPDWRELFARHAPEHVSDATETSRFVHRDDLKYALRSLDVHAPWIRKIHILSNCRPPAWLRTDHPRVNWVDHSAVIEPEFLPTFSSHAIETSIHRIEGLAEHFVYSNDDFYLLRNLSKADMFHSNGIARLRLEQFGTVNGSPDENEPDYLNGARNSATLLQRDFNHWPVKLHTHSPQSMNRTVIAEMEERYSDDFTRTRSNKFRDVSDIAVTGFLYHHYAYLTGRAVPDGADTALVQQNHRYQRIFDQILSRRKNGARSPYLSVCVNDGRGSDENADWQRRALDFLNVLMPEKSQFER